MLSKKYYEMIAHAVRRAREPYVFGVHIASIAQDDVARELATVLANDNPMFDRARFLAACGVAS